MRGFFFVILIAVSASTSRAAIVAGSKDLGNIWIIGDSITQGNASGDSTGTYRSALYNLLKADDYSFDFTGHWSVNAAGLPSDYQYHSGVSGAMIQSNYSGRTGIEQNIGTWWNQGRLAMSKPDVILLMIGTNDVNLGYNTANAPDRLASLIQSLYKLAGNDATLFVASIPPQGGASAVLEFNKSIPATVESYRLGGKDIHYVDMYTPLNAKCSALMNSDNLHPNAAGNEVIAETWRNAIASVAVPEPSSYIPAAICVICLLGGWLGRVAMRRITGKKNENTMDVAMN